MAKYFCVYCGTERSSVSSLTSSMCTKNPTGKYHALYEGTEKKEYTCKYCGTKRSSISSLRSSMCTKNSNGKYHVPAL